MFEVMLRVDTGERETIVKEMCDKIEIALKPSGRGMGKFITFWHNGYAHDRSLKHIKYLQITPLKGGDEG